jgi:hypothetical protein
MAGGAGMASYRSLSKAHGKDFNFLIPINFLYVSVVSIIKKYAQHKIIKPLVLGSNKFLRFSKNYQQP